MVMKKILIMLLLTLMLSCSSFINTSSLYYKEPKKERVIDKTDFSIDIVSSFFIIIFIVVYGTSLRNSG